MANVFQVRPNLVGSAGFQIALQQGYVTQGFQGFIVRNGPFSFRFVVVNGLHFPVFYRAANVARNGAVGRFGDAPDEGLVGSLDGVLEKLPRQVGHGVFGLGNNHQARRVFVDAVYQTGPNFAVAGGG